MVDTPNRQNKDNNKSKVPKARKLILNSLIPSFFFTGVGGVGLGCVCVCVFVGFGWFQGYYEFSLAKPCPMSIFVCNTQYYS